MFSEIGKFETKLLGVALRSVNLQQQQVNKRISHD